MVGVSPTTMEPGKRQTMTAHLAPGEWISGFFNSPESPAIPISLAENGALHTADSTGTATWSWTYTSAAVPGTYILHFLEQNGSQSQVTVTVVPRTSSGLPGWALLAGFGALALYLWRR